eukprot:2728915-Pyramimonas_sp.AAC.1
MLQHWNGSKREVPWFAQRCVYAELVGQFSQVQFGKTTEELTFPWSNLRQAFSRISWAKPCSVNLR